MISLPYAVEWCAYWMPTLNKAGRSKLVIVVNPIPLPLVKRGVLKLSKRTIMQLAK